MLRLDSSVKALITFPRQRSPLLMLMPSYKVAPEAPVRLARSDPAKSTKWNLAVMYSYMSSAGFSPETKSSNKCCSIEIVKIACERLEFIFISVEAVLL